MKGTENIQIIVNTIKKLYTEKQRKLLIKEITKKEFIVNDKRSNQSGNEALGVDITKIDDLQEKIEFLLFRKDEDIPKHISKYVERDEFLKQYRQFSSFEVDRNIAERLKSLIATEEIVEHYLHSEAFEQLSTNLIRSPFFILKDGTYNLKYSKILCDIEGDKIKLNIRVMIIPDKNIINVCFDKIPLRYRSLSEEFYVDVVEEVTESLEILLDTSLTPIDYRPLINYLYENKKEEISVFGTAMSLGGRKAKLVSSRVNGRFQDMLFFGDVDKFYEIEDNIELIEKNDDTRELARRFKKLIDKIRETADYNQYQLNFIKDDVTLSIIHDYLGSPYNLLSFSGNLKYDKELVLYVNERFDNYSREFKISVQSNTYAN